MTNSVVDMMVNTPQLVAPPPAGRKETGSVAFFSRTVPPFPPIVYIEPTNHCNCNCIICPRQNMTRPKGYMAMELFRQIVDQLAMAGPVDVRLFNFGEPLLHPEFPEMIRYGRNLGLSVNFQTNGLNLTEPTIRQLLAAGVSCFGISANGLNAEEYERIRPGYRFREFKENISSLRKIAEACGQAVTIHITAQILCDNRPALKQEIERYALEWTSIADSVSVSGLSPFEGISFLNNGALQEAHAGDLARRKETDVTCNEPFDRLVIKWDGRVTPCCVDFDATWVVGDANLQSIYEIWHSPRMEDLRAVVDRQVYRQNPLCRTCPKFYAKEFTLTFSKRKPEQRT